MISISSQFLSPFNCWNSAPIPARMSSNEKASVTKELNAKHRKILEGLMKLPENRECADCKSRGPRWASVNLGIFVCIQCSGIHRSLGVHISKVRSATLDTWLPEQVAFIQGMGNARANSYWEAELPPNYDRVGLENFIRAKYEEKRWIPRNSRKLKDEKHHSVDFQQHVNGGKDHRGHGHDWNKNLIQETSDRGRHPRVSDAGSSHADKEGDLFDRKNVLDQGHKQHTSPAEETKKLNQEASKGNTIPAISPPKNSSQVVQSPSVTSSQKVEVATDLFDLLKIEEPAEGVDESPSQVDDDNSWAAFQSAEARESTEKNDSTRSSAAKTDVMAGLEDLLAQPMNDSVAHPQPQSQVQVPAQRQSQRQPPADAKKDIMSLFEKSTISSPYTLKQQQMAFLAQQQSMLMAATSLPVKQAALLPTQQQQLLNNTAATPGISLGITTEQVWKNVNYQFPGMMSNLVTQNGLQPSTQAGGIVQLNLSVPQVSAGASGMHTQGVPSFAMPYVAPNISVQANQRHTASSSEASMSSTGANYDFSSLVAGVLSKP